MKDISTSQSFAQDTIRRGEVVPLMEQFYTIQGEGAHTGKAAYFVRIGGCDVGCHWCDVKESWNPDTHPPTPIDSIRGIVQQTGENVNTHHNVKDWHLGESPEVSCLYTVATGKEKSYVIFEYDDGRNKHRRWKVPLEQDQFILFSSNLNHYITHNKNKDFLVNLSLHFQLI